MLPCANRMPALTSSQYKGGTDKETGNVSSVNSANMEVEHKALNEHFSSHFYYRACGSRAFTLHSLSNAAITFSITVPKSI